MANELVRVLSGTILEEEDDVSLGQLCHCCGQREEIVLAMVDEGVLDPLGRDPTDWRFPARSIRHVRVVVRLQRDLGLNLAGCALVLDLLERIEKMRERTL